MSFASRFRLGCIDEDTLSWISFRDVSMTMFALHALIMSPMWCGTRLQRVLFLNSMVHFTRGLLEPLDFQLFRAVLWTSICLRIYIWGRGCSTANERFYLHFFCGVDVVLLFI